MASFISYLRGVGREELFHAFSNNISTKYGHADGVTFITKENELSEPSSNSEWDFVLFRVNALSKCLYLCLLPTPMSKIEVQTKLRHHSRETKLGEEESLNSKTFFQEKSVTY